MKDDFEIFDLDDEEFPDSFAAEDIAGDDLVEEVVDEGAPELLTEDEFAGSFEIEDEAQIALEVNEIQENEATDEVIEEVVEEDIQDLEAVEDNIDEYSEEAEEYLEDDAAELTEEYIDEDGYRIVIDADGNETTYDPNGYRAEYDEEGNEYLYDLNDRRIVYDEEGNAVFFDEDLEFTNLDDLEEDELDTEEYDEDEDEEEKDVKGKIVAFFKGLSAFDYSLAAGMVLILVVGIVLIVTAGNRNKGDDNMFLSVGSQYASLSGLGTDTLNQLSEKAIEATTVEVVEEPEEQDISEITVTFASIDKDLRIKFHSATDNKLVTGIEFEVTLTHKADGDVYTLTDDNKDGMIYCSDMKAGDYTVKITAIDGTEFILDSDTVNVKGQIEYVVIDVVDEVIEDATGVEDTAEKVVEEEELTLVDTVEWVESTRTSLDGTDGYKKIDKNNDIANPESSMLYFEEMTIQYCAQMNPSIAQLIGYGEVYSLVKDNGSGDSASDNKPGEGDGSDTGENGGESGGGSGSGSGETVTITEISVTAGSTSMQVGQDTTCSAVVKLSNGSEIKSSEDTALFSWSVASGDAGKLDGNKFTAEKTGSITIKAVYKGDFGTTEGTVTISVSAAALTISSVEWDASNKPETISTNAATPYVVTVTFSDKSTKSSSKDNSGSGKDFTYEIVSGATECEASFDGNVLTAKKAGTVKIKVIYNGSEDAGSVSKSKELTITVTAPAATFKQIENFNLTATTLVAGRSVTLTPKATMSDGTADTNAANFVWKSSNTAVATVDATGKVTTVAAGSATITAYYKDDSSKKTVSCVVTVKDATTVLKTKNNETVYYKNSSGGYSVATYADYFKYDDFYVVCETNYKYTGWQNINGNTYFYDKNGNKVTGTQIINGVEYKFTDDGILSVDNNGILGIDVSVWQGSIDWTKVKESGINFVIIRYGYRGSTQGGIYKDTKFDQNIAGAKAAGLKVGIYFFTQAITEAEAVEEASACIAAAKQYGISYPIFIDTESGGAGARAENLSVAQRTAVCKAFCETVKNSGYTAGVYASKWWFGAKLNYSELTGYRIWLAQYASAPSLNGRYDLWQYSSKGSVSGISGNVDMDISYMGY